MKIKKHIIYISLIISLVNVLIISILLFCYNIDNKLLSSFLNICCGFFSGSFVTTIITLKEYKSNFCNSIDKIAYLYLKLDNELGAIRYYENKISLNLIANSISVCVEYIQEINVILFNVYQGLFRKKSRKAIDVERILIIIECCYLNNFYAMGQILQNDKEYAKKNIKLLYSKLVDIFYNEKVIEELNNFFRKYKSKLGFYKLSDSSIISENIDQIKKEIEKTKKYNR